MDVNTIIQWELLKGGEQNKGERKGEEKFLGTLTNKWE